MALDVTALEALGYFKHAGSAEERAHLRDKIAASKSPLSVSVRRDYHADAEDLDERGVLDFIGKLAPYLRHEGVPIEVVYQWIKQIADPARGLAPHVGSVPNFDADGWFDPPKIVGAVERFFVALSPGGPLEEGSQSGSDDTDYILYLGNREIIIHRDGETDMSWYRATRVTIALLEELLVNHGSRDRIYVDCYGSNDQTFYFLTPEMAKVINTHYAKHPLLASDELEAHEERA